MAVDSTVNRRPIPIYLKWENDEIYDILWYAGARKNKPSDQSKAAHIVLDYFFLLCHPNFRWILDPGSKYLV